MGGCNALLRLVDTERATSISVVSSLRGVSSCRFANPLRNATETPALSGGCRWLRRHEPRASTNGVMRQGSTLTPFPGVGPKPAREPVGARILSRRTTQRTDARPAGARQCGADADSHTARAERLAADPRGPGRGAGRLAGSRVSCRRQAWRRAAARGREARDRKRKHRGQSRPRSGGVQVMARGLTAVVRGVDAFNQSRE